MKNYKINYLNLILLLLIFTSTAFIIILDGASEIMGVTGLVAALVCYRFENGVD